MSAVNLGLPNALSNKAAPRRGEVPYATMTEQMLLGMFMLDDKQCLEEGVDKMLIATDFFLREHQAIWNAVMYEVVRNEPICVPTVAYALEKMGLIDKVDQWVSIGGLSGTEPYLVELTGYAFSSVGASAHARIIKEYSERRDLIQYGTEMVQDGYAGSTPVRRLGGVRIA